MANELSSLSLQKEALAREKSNQQARERHSNATGGGAGGRGRISPSVEAEKKKVEELEKAVELLQTEKAVSD